MPKEHSIHWEHDECGEQIEVPFLLEYEPGGMYGADADGNRGTYVYGYYYVCGEAPDTCSHCKQPLNKVEQKLITDKMEQYAHDYTN